MFAISKELEVGQWSILIHLKGHVYKIKLTKGIRMFTSWPNLKERIISTCCMRGKKAGLSRRFREGRYSFCNCI